MSALSQITESNHANRMIELPDTRGLTIPEAASAWASLNLRLSYENISGERPVGKWRYADRDKKHLMQPDTPERAKAIAEQHKITRLMVEPAENIVVLDIDHRPEQGWDAIAIGKILRIKFDIQDCPIVRTPSGGFHLWLQLPHGFKARNWTYQHGRFPVDGVDIRTNGGLAVSPPSTRAAKDGKQAGKYQWLGSCRTLPMASPALVEALTPPAYEPRDVGEVRAFVGDISAYCEAALQSELAAIAHCGKGGRNLQLFKSSAALASIVAAGGLPEEHTKDALLTMAKHNGLAKEDGIRAVLATIESGFASGVSNPRRLPTEGGAL